MASRLHRWLELDGGPGRLLAMEGLRGIAVTLVFLQHYGMQSILYVDLGPVGGEIATLLRNYGTLGVELFFVLSGFLIYGTLLRRRPGFAAFMWRRAQRLYPAFLCVFAPLVAWHAWRGTGDLPEEPLRAVLVVAANVLFLPGVVAIDPIMTVAWSLSWEVLCYLLLAVLVPGLALQRWSRPGRIALILAGLAAVSAAAAALPDGAAPFASPLPMLPFLAGMLLFEAEDARWPAVPGWLALAAGAVSLLLGEYVAPGELARAWMETAALALLCAAAIRGGNVAARLLRLRALRWIGNMSYSVYLVHGLVVVAVFRGLVRLAGADWPGAVFWLLAAPVFLLALAASLVLFVVVERPCSLRRE